MLARKLTDIKKEKGKRELVNHITFFFMFLGKGCRSGIELFDWIAGTLQAYC